MIDMEGLLVIETLIAQILSDDKLVTGETWRFLFQLIPTCIPPQPRVSADPTMRMRMRPECGRLRPCCTEIALYPGLSQLLTFFCFFFISVQY